MKGIVKKINKGRVAYYFELFLQTKEGKKGISRYLGTEMPTKEWLSEKVFEYYQEFAEVVKPATADSIKDYFKYTGVEAIEDNRFYYWGLKHESNREKHGRFQAIFMILFILNSARSEGSRMKKSDLTHSLADKKAKTFEQKEAVNTLKAIQWAFSPQFTWSTLSIRKLHYLMFHDLEPEFAGRYKPYDNVVGSQLGGQIIDTISFDQVPEKMKDWIEEVKRERRRIYPPIFALESHLKFETIHPFHDGNGRIGRILLNRLLLENNFMPAIFFEENHKAYCSSISAAREGRKDKYIKLFVKQLKKTRKVFEEEKNNDEFVSVRKKLSISIAHEGNRNTFRFEGL